MEKMGYGLKFGKGKIAGQAEMTAEEKDKAFKTAFTYLYFGYRASIGDPVTMTPAEFMQRNVLHHIKRKKPHPELRYVFSNCELIPPDLHDKIHNGNADYNYDNRDPDFVVILKSCEF